MKDGIGNQATPLVAIDDASVGILHRFLQLKLNAFFQPHILQELLQL